MILTRTSAIVLKVTDHGESDKIVTFYSSTAGRQVAIARGAKRSTKRFVNKLEIFSWLEIHYGRQRPDALAQIDEAELLDPFIALRSNYEKYVAASTIIELILSWARENDADEALYNVLLWSLQNLKQELDALPLVIFFYMKLLGIVGYRPHLEGCIKCEAKLVQGSYWFNINRGGLLCARCLGDSSPGTSLVPLSLSTIKLLCSSQEMELDKVNRLRFSAVSIKESILLLKQYGEHLLQREIHSWAAITGPSGFI